MRTLHQLYVGSNEPVTLQFDESPTRHSYKILAPERLAGVKTGVTTTFDILNKPELVQWAANKAVEAIQNGLKPSEAKYAHRKAKEDAGDIGTRVHFWIENHLAGKDLPYEDDMKSSILGYLRWEKKYQPKIYFSERVVYSKNFDYPGKVDLGAKIGNRYGIIDFKTGSCDKEYDPKSKRYTGMIRARTEHFVQDAAYDIAIAEEDGLVADFYGVLYIPVDGNVEYFTTNDVLSCQEAFIETLQTRRLWHDLKFNNKFRKPTRGLSKSGRKGKNVR